MKRSFSNHLALLFAFLVFSCKTFAGEPPFLAFKNDDWVNQTLESLTLEEQIAQLMIVTVYPEQGEINKDKTIEEIKSQKPGGIIVMQGNPARITSWINSFQEVSEVPLLVSIDAEWGLTMRLDSAAVYPHAQAIGAVRDSTFVYQMGYDIGNQLKKLGVNMNFAPVADVNTNPQNPVINFRSFGEDKINVAEKAWQVAKGMQDAGIIPVAKHFPGHGDTKSDSHKALPIVAHSKERIDDIESYPFRYLAKKGICGVMSAHLNVPALDDSGTPSSLSKKIITEYLKNEIGFKGFVVTDAINMKGARTAEGNTELRALIAGNDIVEFVPNVKLAIESVKQGIVNGEITESEINEKCRTVLSLKRWVKLNEYKPAKVVDVASRLNSPFYEVTNRKLIEGTLTVLKNDSILPVQHLEKTKIASVVIGSGELTPFQKMLANYTQVDQFYLKKDATERDWAAIRNKLSDYNLIIGGIQGISKYSSYNYRITEIQKKAVSEIVQENNSVFVFFGNAYALKFFKNIHHASGLVVAYQDNQLVQELAAQLVFGAIGANGRLPVGVDERFKLDDGLEISPNNCLAYTIPEELNISADILHHKIDSIAMLGVDSAAYPGCQVLVAKDGKVIFHKCYGYHTYAQKQKVVKENIYDWASVTKVTGPLPALMKMVDESKMDIDNPFSSYWADFKDTEKADLSVREILAHQAGLAPWIPFWQMAVDEDGRLDSSVFKSAPSKEFSVRVSENLYMNNEFRKTMYDTIQNSRLLLKKKYLYSGLSFYLYPDIISHITKTPYEQYIKQNFYEPLGAFSITYNPYKYFPLKRMLPTETDDFFRNEKLRGFVHDEGAAMMGGVSGNAGLFGTTNDLAKLFQMYLQMGYFGGRRYISEKTMAEFTKIQFPRNDNRRGLGFDKPLILNSENSLENAYPAVTCSKNSFGHSGYTGTFAWADPGTGVLFIFMSNRVCPTRENPKLYQLNIRTAMHQAIYDCIEKGIN